MGQRKARYGPTIRSHNLPRNLLKVTKPTVKCIFLDLMTELIQSKPGIASGVIVPVLESNRSPDVAIIGAGPTVYHLRHI